MYKEVLSPIKIAPLNIVEIGVDVTPSEVEKIRDMYTTGKWSYDRLAARFACGASTVKDIIKGNTHKVKEKETEVESK